MSFDACDQPIDWQELDRLVDGQLSDDEYRRLLKEIESHPGGWRQCALAFLEHQAFTKEMSAIGMDQPLAVSGGAIASESALDCFDDLVDSEVESKLDPVAVAQPTTSQQHSGATIAWLSMAVCVLVGLAFGLAMQSEFRETLRARTTIKNPKNDLFTYQPDRENSADESAASSMDYRNNFLATTPPRTPSRISRSSPSYDENIHPEIAAAKRCRLSEGRHQCGSKATECFDLINKR